MEEQGFGRWKGYVGDNPLLSECFARILNAMQGFEMLHNALPLVSAHLDLCNGRTHTIYEHGYRLLCYPLSPLLIVHLIEPSPDEHPPYLLSAGADRIQSRVT